MRYVPVSRAGVALIVCSCAAIAAARDVTLVKKGRSYVTIYTSLEAEAPAAEAKENPARARLRAAVADLAAYLEKMSGAKIESVHSAPPAKPKTIPILIGDLGTKRFGPPSVKSPFQQALRVVVSKDCIACIGESDEATSDAIYEILHRLGCRWYLPSELGEDIPRMETIRLPKMDVSKTPPTVYRNIWYADNAYKRRNRLGGIYYWAAHSLEGYVSKQELAQHPDWNAEFSDGKRPVASGRICWGNPEVAKAIAEVIVQKLDESYRSCMSLSPGDGMTFCQCAKCKSFDAGDWDTTTSQMSMSDRYVHFCNQIAEEVRKKHPRVIFGSLAYEQYTRAPVREKLHPSLVPMIAPILYCRAHSMVNPNCPSRHRLRGIVEGWGKVTRMLAIDDYAFNLAEVSCPFPLISKWSGDLPIYYANHMTLWKPETMPTFEASLPGLYLGIRMSWYPESKPAAILEEFFTRFYGAAAAPMRRYWYTIDDAWAKTAEHAGCYFGHAVRFTPEVMKAARAAMDDALAACKTITEYRRAKLADDSLRQFELYMKMLRDYHRGRWVQLEKDALRWHGGWDSLTHEYRKQHAFTHYGSRYFARFGGLTYKEATRVAMNFQLLTKPLRQWRCQADKDGTGEQAGWGKPDYDDQDWQVMDPCVDTSSSLGRFDYFGLAWYRAKVKVPAVKPEKKVFLWVGCVDSTCKLFVNGQHVSYVDKKGETKEHFAGYARPASFNVTSAVKPGADNHIAMLCSRGAGWINEIGTGGLMGPVLFYAEK